MTPTTKKVRPAGTAHTRETFSSNNNIPREPVTATRAALLTCLVSAYATRPREAMSIAHDAGWQLGHTISEETAERVLLQLVHDGIARIVDYEAFDVSGNPAPRFDIGEPSRPARISDVIVDRGEYLGDGVPRTAGGHPYEPLSWGSRLKV